MPCRMLCYFQRFGCGRAGFGRQSGPSVESFSPSGESLFSSEAMQYDRRHVDGSMRRSRTCYARRDNGTGRHAVTKNAVLPVPEQADVRRRWCRWNKMGCQRSSNARSRGGRGPVSSTGSRPRSMRCWTGISRRDSHNGRWLGGTGVRVRTTDRGCP